ncbi:MAG: VCBS repeat-containing protein [Acidimicrobiia bacterium]|nr:VCBS repeat-containing protein [Acidimicrobiia bacterium]
MLFRTLTLIACTLGLAGPMPAISDVPDAVEVTFDQYEVVTGSAERQTVVTGFLLGGAVAELAVLNIDENDDRRLRLYAFGDGAWVPRLDATLGPQVLFVDVANVGGRDRLVSYEPGRLNWFDPESATERSLVAVTSSFNPPRRDEIAHVDLTRDVNADDRDDLVLPDVDGFWVFIQMSDGAFADPVKIGPCTDMSRILGADGYRYDPWPQSRIHEMDYNHDGRSDLVFWDEDHFEVHLQDERGLFTPEARSFRTGVAFDSDDLSSLSTGEMTGRVLHSLTDLNGDGVGDLVVHSLEGTRISSKRSSYKVHFGIRAADGGTAFATEAGATFRSDNRIQIGMDRNEFDRDGEVGLMVTSIEVKFLEGSLWKRIKGAMGDDVILDLEFYRTEDGRYPDKPNVTHRIALDGVPSHREPGWVPLDIVLRGPTHESRRTQTSWPRAFNRTLLIGDVSGDGRSDLLIEPEFRDLHIFSGVPGPGLFARQPHKVAVTLHDEEFTWLVDLNRDGKQDILVHHPFTSRNAHGARIQPPGTEPHRVTLLIAR